FPGAQRILAELNSGPCRRRVGLRPDGRMPVREGHVLTNDDGEVVGRISSGGYGATVEAPLAMGYVDTEYAPPGTQLSCEIRGRIHGIHVADLPFVQRRYHR
ncbi:MAG: glycine cleavage T C-terminal barrel domain-containing protein, partial [Gammaproteobacteria bacterium]